MGTGTVIDQLSILILFQVLFCLFLVCVCVCVWVCSRKFHGYNSLKEYYEEESCMRYLHRVSGHSSESNISELASLHPAPPTV